MNDIEIAENFLNNFEEIETIPIDYIASDDEIIETFSVQEDGSLIPATNGNQRKKLTRKRLRNHKNWKRNISKLKRQSGKSYRNVRGEIQPAKFVKNIGCANPSKCEFQCMAKINREGRQSIFDSFWLLPDSEKRHFYVSNVKKVKCQPLKYHFNYMDEDVRVCQQFFINTLNVNKGRIYYYFGKNSRKSTITPGKYLHGAHPKKVISNVKKQEVRDHINRFPVVESHYCRKNSSKLYLYQGLNLATMYRLFVEETNDPVKLSVYRYIFNYEYNLSFFKPKKDRCDKCVAYELLSSPTETQIDDHNLHLQRKSTASCERKKDREISETTHRENKSAVGCFDMENVFQLPISNASVVYYRRKFAALNLTLVINGVVYCAMWDESLCGREGTHIANALIKILKRVLKDNVWMEHLTLWSDSCTPQNRNSIMSAALQSFLDSDESFNLHQIDQKFSEAGHGLVQEVDSAHSVIERFLRNKFIYSPPSLLAEISKIPKKKLKFDVIPMEENDYLDYQSIAHAHKYSTVPYTKVKQLTYMKNQTKLMVKLEFDQNWLEKPISLKPRNTIDVKKPSPLTLISKLSVEKMTDIRSMFTIMPSADQAFYENVMKTSANLQSIRIGSSSQVQCILSEPIDNANDSKQKLPNIHRTVPKSHTKPTCQLVSQTKGNDKDSCLGNESILAESRTTIYSQTDDVDQKAIESECE